MARDILIAALDWRRDLIWRKSAGSNAQVMAATIQTTSQLQAGPPRVVYTYNAAADGPSVEVLAGDGKQFAGSRTIGPPIPSAINLIINWVEELKQRVK